MAPWERAYLALWSTLLLWTHTWFLRAGLWATAPSRSAAAPVVRSGAPPPGSALLPRLAAPTSVPATPSPATWTCVSDRCPPTARARRRVSSPHCPVSIEQNLKSVPPPTPKVPHHLDCATTYPSTGSACSMMLPQIFTRYLFPASKQRHDCDARCASKPPRSQSQTSLELPKKVLRLKTYFCPLGKHVFCEIEKNKLSKVLKVCW